MDASEQYACSRPACGPTAAVWLVVFSLLPCSLLSFSPSSAHQMTTFAGGGPLPHQVPPLEAPLYGLVGLAVDPADGAIYLSDSSRHAIYRINPGRTVLTAVAGTGSAGFNGDGLDARSTSFHVPVQLAVDPLSGDLYVADAYNHRIRVIRKAGRRIETVAGSGIRDVPSAQLPTDPPRGPGLLIVNFSGDGGPAVQAELNRPSGIAFDSSGNLFISDSANHRVRVVNLRDQAQVFAGVTVMPGCIQTIAGTGETGSAGAGGPALKAQITFPRALLVDRSGDLVVADSLSHRLLKIRRRDGILEDLADFSRQPRHPATSAQSRLRSAPSIEGLALSPEGDIVFSDVNRHTVYRLGAPGSPPDVVAGTGIRGHSMDGTPADQSPVAGPTHLAYGKEGELLFVESANFRLRSVKRGRLRTVAGRGSPDPGLSAAEAPFPLLAGISADSRGRVLVPDSILHSIRRISPSGRVETLLSGIRATTVVLSRDDRFLYFAESDANLVWRIDLEGERPYRPEIVAGNRGYGSAGDGGQATEAELSGPMGLAVHPWTNELYLSNIQFPTIRKVNSNGIISRVAGTGQSGFAGDGGPALQARFHWPTSIEFDRRGNLYVADFFNHRIRMITPEGMVSTIAGSGVRGFSGEGTPAAAAKLNNPNDLEVDFAGNLLFTDANNHRVRMVDAWSPRPTIRTIAGTGERGYSGDGGAALEARLNVPRGLALDDGGGLFVTDSLNGRIRMIRSAGLTAAPAQQTLSWTLQGVADEGKIELAFSGADRTCRLRFATFPGEDARHVAAALAAVLSRDPCLITQAIAALAAGANLRLKGPALRHLSTTITDPGLRLAQAPSATPGSK